MHRVEAREVLAFRADLGGVALAAGVEAARTGPPGLVLPLLVEAIGASRLTRAVRVQVMERGAVQTNARAYAGAAVGRTACAAPPQVIRPLPKVAVGAGAHTLHATCVAKG